MAVELPRLMAAVLSTDVNEYVGDNAISAVSQGSGTGCIIQSDGGKNKFRMRNGGYAQFNIPASTELVVGFHLRLQFNEPNPHQFVTFLNASGQEIANLHYTGSAGTVRVRRGTAVLATSTGTLSTSETFLELSIKLAAAGDYALRFNGGATDISATGVDTENNAGPCTAVRLGWPPGGSVYGWYNDIYIRARTEGADDGYYGPIEAVVEFVAADTVQKDGTPSTGSDNYAMLDEADADGDMTYVDFAGAGEADRYGLSGSFSTAHPGLVKCVAAFSIAKRPSAGSTNLRHKLTSGVTTDTGNTRTLADGTYQCQMTAWETNPDTAVAFTASDIDDVEITVETV